MAGRSNPGSKFVADETRIAEALADLVHELRTPLGGIEAMTELLAAFATTREQKRLIAGLKAASAHLRAVAANVIDGDGQLGALYALNPVRFGIGALLDPIVAAANARAQIKGIRFTLDCALTPEAIVEIDPARTRQMIENLIDNAFKVTGHGEVTLRVVSESARLVFSILDNGPGFSAADLEYLFERRMQVAGGPRGSGIGLALVKKYAHAAGGDCGGLNRQGGGAEVWFALPQAEPIEDTPRPRRHALVIEDSYAGRLLMRTMLEHFGFSVDLAVGAAGALEAIAMQDYDLITVDKMLGDSDGIEVTRLLRDRLGKSKKAHIVAVTGRVDDADRAGFALAGADAFLPKPLSPRAMAEVLNRLGLGLRPDTGRAA